jgi:hypothetical protein
MESSEGSGVSNFPSSHTRHAERAPRRTYTLSPIWASNVRGVTGLIYIVIIALWAAVLIPMWLRRHDQISEVRSTARFENSMARLGSHDDVQFSRGGRDHMNRQITFTPSGKRRAIVLASLTGLTALTLLLALVSAAPKWMPILFGLLTAAFMVASAMTASARTQAAPARVRRTSPASRSERTTAPASAKAAVEDDWENWNAWDDEDEAWEAVPTTLPTYVTAPRASQVPRPIDKARPGEWTGSAMVEAAQEMREASAAQAAEIAAVAAAYDDITAEIPVISADYDRRAANQ